MRATSIHNRVERVKSIQDRFDIIEQIGGGTYGIVHKCIDRKSNSVVALKKIHSIPGEYDSPHTMREIELMHELSGHDNIVKLKQIIQSEHYEEHGFYLVLEYCEYDLYALLYAPSDRKIDPTVMKSLMKQFLVSLHYLTIKKVVHRDLKPANLFVTRNGILKLGDFGLGRKLPENADKFRMSTKVITLWYRPPELLLAYEEPHRRYGIEVDIWSAGCILFEMATSKVLLHPRENKEMSMLMSIFSVMGLPKPDEMPELHRSHFFQKLRDMPTESRLGDILKENIPPEYEGLDDLIMRMMQYNPGKRITAEEALKHPFISNLGPETRPDKMPMLHHEEIHQMKASENKRRERERESERLRVEKSKPSL